jgi:hypothetical protein
MGSVGCLLLFNLACGGRTSPVGSDVYETEASGSSGGSSRGGSSARGGSHPVAGSSGQPTPQPEPTMAPWACESLRGDEPSGCHDLYHCADGPWFVDCVSVGGAAICDCTWPAGALTQIDAGPFAAGLSCQQATLQCFGPIK